MQLQPQHSFAMSVHGQAKGRTGLKVTVRALDPQAGHLAGNVAELSDEIQVQVRSAAAECSKQVCEMRCRVQACDILYRAGVRQTALTESKSGAGGYPDVSKLCTKASD